MSSEELESELKIWDKKFEEDVKSGKFFVLTNKWVIDFERGHFQNFWKLYEKLPNEVKSLADNNFLDINKKSKNALLNILRVGRYWSMPIGEVHRALGVEIGDDGLLWCWVGSYAEYNKFIDALNKANT